MSQWESAAHQWGAKCRKYNQEESWDGLGRAEQLEREEYTPPVEEDTRESLLASMSAEKRRQVEAWERFHKRRISPHQIRFANLTNLWKETW
jgi:hypothetical protein